MKRKILYSPGYGAGWTSWNSNEDLILFMLTYQPFIDYLESGNNFNEEANIYKTSDNPIVQKFIDECQEKFNQVPYLGGLNQLKVASVDGLVRINEYNGSESYEEQNTSQGWM